ncbi:MAG: hypothetical protein JSV94_06520, partial [Methanobacteriota archaeon]
SLGISAAGASQTFRMSENTAYDLVDPHFQFIPCNGRMDASGIVPIFDDRTIKDLLSRLCLLAENTKALSKTFRERMPPVS